MVISFSLLMFITKHYLRQERTGIFFLSQRISYEFYYLITFHLQQSSRGMNELNRNKTMLLIYEFYDDDKNEWRQRRNFLNGLAFLKLNESGVVIVVIKPSAQHFLVNS